MAIIMFIFICLFFTVKEINKHIPIADGVPAGEVVGEAEVDALDTWPVDEEGNAGEGVRDDVVVLVTAPGAADDVLEATDGTAGN